MQLIAHLRKPKVRTNYKESKREFISEEDMEIIWNIEETKELLHETRQRLDYATEPLLIDSYAYELKAITTKYEYYVKLCKEKGIVAGIWIYYIYFL